MWIGYHENIITKQQEKRVAQCQSIGLKPTIDSPIFFVITVCSNWKLHDPNVWAHTHCQLFLQYVSATLSLLMRFFWLPCGILCIKQRQQLLSYWRGVLIERRYFCDQTSRRLLSVDDLRAGTLHRWWHSYVIGWWHNYVIGWWHNLSSDDDIILSSVDDIFS